MLIHQVEFLIEGFLLPPTIGRLQISENLVLEQVYRKGSETILAHESRFYTIAYVGVRTPKKANPFRIAGDYLDFFLLIYSLTSGQPLTALTGIGTTLDDMGSLGNRRIGFPSFERIEVLGEHKDDPLRKPIEEAKKRFLTLLPDIKRIMGSPLGLALTYYYFAVLASKRRLEECVIHLFIAAEALLSTDPTKIRKNLSERLSTLIAGNISEGREISRKILKLYELRCGIVHGGGKKPSLSDVRVLFDYVRKAIERGISLRHLSKEELVAKLEEAFSNTDVARELRSMGRNKGRASS